MATYVPSQCVVLINQALDADVKSAIPANVPHIVVWNKVTNCIQYVNTNTGDVLVEMCYGGPAASCATGNFDSETDARIGTNEDTPVVFATTFNLLLDAGKWRVNFGGNATGAADPGPALSCTLDLVINVNQALTSYDPTDVTIAQITHNGLALGATDDWKMCAEFTTLVPVIVKVIYRGAQNAPIVVSDQYSVAYKTLDATLICQLPA